MRTWRKRLVSVGLLAAFLTPVAVVADVAASEETSQAEAAYSVYRWVYYGTYRPGTGNAQFTCAVSYNCAGWQWRDSTRYPGQYDLYLLRLVPVRV